LSQLEGTPLDQARPGFDAALVAVNRADKRLSSPSVELLRWVPVLGRTSTAERA
jgi:hypothetical protein